MEFGVLNSVFAHSSAKKLRRGGRLRGEGVVKQGAGRWKTVLGCAGRLDLRAEVTCIVNQGAKHPPGTLDRSLHGDQTHTSSKLVQPKYPTHALLQENWLDGATEHVKILEGCFGLPSRRAAPGAAPARYAGKAWRGRRRAFGKD